MSFGEKNGFKKIENFEHKGIIEKCEGSFPVCLFLGVFLGVFSFLKKEKKILRDREFKFLYQTLS